MTDTLTPKPSEDGVQRRTRLSVYATPADRLAAYTVADPETGCVNWTRSLSHNGYGVISMGLRRRASAHRTAYELAVGPIPDGLQIDHLCRNRRCVNPAHLECVTREENIARGNAPHILNAKKTHCKRGHSLSDANVTIVRGRPRRACASCERDRRADISASREVTRALNNAAPAMLAALKAMVDANDSAVNAMMECVTEEAAMEIATTRGEAFGDLIEPARAAIAQAEAVAK